MDKGLAEARILNKKGNLLENFRAMDGPRISSGFFWVISSRDLHFPWEKTFEGALGWAPIQSSACGLSDGLGSPMSFGINVFDPQEYSRILFFKTPILLNDNPACFGVSIQYFQHSLQALRPCGPEANGGEAPKFIDNIIFSLIIMPCFFSKNSQHTFQRSFPSY